eukprot:TRINITY_DN3441_c0_g1_i3.p1 TRINITY_DN3441_c0_g1~~TRINITY_DN3441_c0_g1_i3.p1  ORF type:complete len:1400 (-),score=428.10 TRINITY_DN3441_c0_g1_i3:135-4334(-)
MTTSSPGTTHSYTFRNNDSSFADDDRHIQERLRTPLPGAMSPREAREGPAPLHASSSGHLRELLPDGAPVNKQTESVSGRDTPANPSRSNSMEMRDDVRIITMSSDKAHITGYTNEYSKIKIAASEDPNIINELHHATDETQAAAQLLLEGLTLRTKYDFGNDKTKETDAEDEDLFDTENLVPEASNITFVRENGVYIVDETGNKAHAAIGPLEFLEDYSRMRYISASGPCKSFTYQRLKVLEYKYDIHRILNEETEKLASKSDPKHFSNIVKVDTHIHLAAGMTSRHLLEFIKRKSMYFGDDPILENKNGEVQNLKGILKKLGLKPSDLTVNALDVYADNTFQRFDNFNAKYNPFGISELRTVFLKIDNYGKGKYFAELTNELFERNTRLKYIKTECRISIYGRKKTEWADLANWIFDNKVYSESNRWLIQMPRIYDVFKTMNEVQSFAEMIDNIFLPLFEVSKNPAFNPKLHLFLKQISGFDSVDDESKVESKLARETFISPEEWTSSENPTYAYYMYFCWANLYTLNKLRAARGLNTFDFRPHSGESGDVEHLAATFLLAKGINHGINLEKNTVLQYLYYMAQIGIAASPLSNNSLFLDYKRNPFPLFFRRGLNVSLSTDDPLQFHLTENPLLEEYEIAAKRWRFTGCDVSEIARNSVVQSGFEHRRKMKWIGPKYLKPGPAGNDIAFTNVPNMRISFRYETLKEELALVRSHALHSTPLLPFSFSFVSPQEGTGVVMPMFSKEDVEAAVLIHNCLNRRRKYVMVPKRNPENTNPISPPSDYEFKRVNGVIQLFRTKEVFCSYDTEELAVVHCETCDSNFCEECDKVLHKAPSNRDHKRSFFKAADPVFPVHTFKSFVRDYHIVERVRQDPNSNTFAAVRLSLLELCFKMYELLNTQFEKESMRRSKVDFESIYKVDTHVHIASASTAGHFLDFMKRKLKSSPDEPVLQVKDKSTTVTLREVFTKCGIPIEDLTLDSLDVKASMSTFGFFDKFNNTYNPFGSNDMRTIFLKKDNFIKGKYFAELCLEVFRKHDKQVHNMTEYRISIYGRRKDEWSDLARWISVYKVSSEKVRWVIQVPRLYHIYKQNKLINNFQEMLDNIFMPLFEITHNPSSNLRLHSIMPLITGFDSVDDENYAVEKIIDPSLPPPAEWTSDENPPYAYYMYYMWANIYSLNKFREARGMSTFTFRPHCGAVGSRAHLSAAYLVANGIAHGINLMKAPTLQYMYYLDQIGIYLSPLGEDVICCSYEQNPFHTFFKRGLNISLSTDNPLQLHSTDEPLMEEYSIAAKMWKLSLSDMSELARNSILQSSFEHSVKMKCLGPNYYRAGIAGNDIQKSNLPNVRIHFRSETLRQERGLLHQIVKNLGSEVDIAFLRDNHSEDEVIREQNEILLRQVIT